MTQPWSFSRLEIRTPLAVNGGSLARVELVHKDRGRITDIGRADTPMESVFRALGQIVGIEAEVRSIGIDYRPSTAERHASISAEVVLQAGGEACAGRGVSHDLLISCVNAYLDALRRGTG